MLMTTQMSITHLLRASMIKCNGRSNSNKWAVCFKALIDNTVVVEHKYKHSLSIKIGNNYEREEQQNQKVHSAKNPL